MVRCWSLERNLQMYTTGELVFVLALCVLGALGIIIPFFCMDINR